MFVNTYYIETAEQSRYFNKRDRSDGRDGYIFMQEEHTQKALSADSAYPLYLIAAEGAIISKKGS